MKKVIAFIIVLLLAAALLPAAAFAEDTDYTITYADAGGIAAGGSYWVYWTSAAEGEKVYIYTEASCDYGVESVTFIPEGGTATNATLYDPGCYEFTMPAGNVEVKVTFKEKVLVLKVGGVQVTDANKGDITSAINAAVPGAASGTATFDPASKTLTLNNFHLNCTSEDAILAYDGDDVSNLMSLNILLYGENSIVCPKGGIFAGNLTISSGEPNASLSVNAKEEAIYSFTLEVKNTRIDAVSLETAAIECYYLDVVGSFIDADGYLDDWDDGSIICDEVNLNDQHKVYIGVSKDVAEEVATPDSDTYEFDFVRIAPKDFEYYPVWIGGTQFTEDCLSVAGTTGTAAYDPATGTLTLDNYSYTGKGQQHSGMESARYYSALYTSSDLTVKLRGQNSLSCLGDDEHGTYEGIVSFGTLTICDDPADSGAGKLSVRGKPTGIYADKLVIRDCKVEAAAETLGQWDDVDAVRYSAGLTVKGSELRAVAAPAGGSRAVSTGIYCNGYVANATATFEDSLVIAVGADVGIEGDVTPDEDNEVYAGENETEATENGPVAAPTAETYAKKYVKIKAKDFTELPDAPSEQEPTTPGETPAEPQGARPNPSTSVTKEVRENTAVYGIVMAAALMGALLLRRRSVR